MTAEEIKNLPRTGEGIFDLNGMDKNIYAAAAKVFPIYADFETRENKKEGYPDIMAQMRILNRMVKNDFSFENAAAYVEMLLATIEKMSPEIYENYRELVDMFREAVRLVIEKYYDRETGEFKQDKNAVGAFAGAVKTACDGNLLLAEKYLPYTAA